MIRTACTIATLAIIALPTGESHAEILKGKWGGKSPSILEFLDGQKVRYCFQGKCTVQPYTGNKSQKIEFNWGAAEFTFTKTTDGYDGTYRLVQTSTIKMK